MTLSLLVYERSQDLLSSRGPFHVFRCQVDAQHLKPNILINYDCNFSLIVL